MRLVMGAQNCGFGPASVLVAVSRLLPGHQRVFVGDGVAAAFAHRNADAFGELHDPTGTDDLLKGADQVVSAMNADLAVRAVVAGRPLVMVDSLFSFWRLHHPLTHIRDLCATMPRGSFAAAERHLSGLSPHERVIAAHFLATHSVVQNFPGVPRRIAEFTGAGGRSAMHLTGPVIDTAGLREVALRASAAPDPAYDLLVNIGGFTNFLLSPDVNNAYLRLLHRWLPDLLRDWRRFGRVLVCGGPFGGNRAVTVSAGGRQADCKLLPQRHLLRQVACTPHYLLAPGLSALHEALALGQLPLAAPEQHYAHVFTVRELGGTLFGRTACRLADVLPRHPVPEDDTAGTAALVAIADRIAADDKLYARFRQTLNERIEQHLSLTAAQRSRGVRELREAFDGAQPASLIAGLVDGRGRVRSP
ncbi:hypothetical protein ACIHFE_24970 [Streptomyces sp. NPDC052396]|uniref:hypothetical protein n=1 Tax=Streptomyces sp. NPDC052396 TaxID=3365689 RepID=UPI0037D75B67